MISQATPKVTTALLDRLTHQPVDEVEQELAARLGERQISEFVENNEVHPGQLIGRTRSAIPRMPGWW